MIAPKPRPRFPYPSPRLLGERKRMTLIGAIKCNSDVVICADRQETITDYAKWDCCKITHFELQGLYRVLMVGAGDSNLIEMIRDRFEDNWKRLTSSAPQEIKTAILTASTSVTEEAVLPYLPHQGPNAEIIWAVQRIDCAEPIDLFRTSGFSVNKIRRHYFTGNPILLARYLADMYVDPHILTTSEAEALTAYILWECKEYDPTVGKHSDIVTLNLDGTMRRMSRLEEMYWEEHFFEIKKATRIIPIISCSDKILNAVYDPNDYLERLKATLSTLVRTQQNIRLGMYQSQTLSDVVQKEVKADYQRRQKSTKKSQKKTKQSTPETSEDQQ